MPKFQFVHLVDLPQECLHAIFSLLAPADLAGLAVQDQYLRCVASDSALWEGHCLARWPGAAAELYSGSWCRLYQARAVMPAAFPLAADKIRALTSLAREAAGGSSEAAAAAAAAPGQQQQQSAHRRQALDRLGFEEVMRTLVSAGMNVSREAGLRRTAEFKALRKDVAWWLNERPQVVVGFARGAQELLHGWAGGLAVASSSGTWADATWRRSALAFLQQELGLLTPAHQSVVERLARETQALDRAMRGAVGERSERGWQAAAEDAPRSHWWYRAAVEVAA